ncbi:MAG: 3-oxoacyl-ACP reductase [Frondihabitans sp.]|nr:3-oxoacyl-ACP reductase [Frondihabitans sp.]
MNLDLEGKVAVVTGASRGIGRATVNALRREGARVAAVSRGAAGEASSEDLVWIRADLILPDAPAAVTAEALKAFGGIDLLVNNVGGGSRLGLADFATLTDDDWDDAIATNLMSAVRMTRAALPYLESSGGAIVNVSSIGARKPEGPPLAYNIAKAALTALGHGLAVELGPRGIRVNTVSPGPTRTAMWESPEGLGGQLAAILGAPIDAIVAGAPAQVGMVTGRISEPEEVADLIAYLLSPRAANITGVDYLIDGGATRAV